MGLSIFPIHAHLLRCVGRIIDLEAINGNLLSELVKQVSIEAGKANASSRMGDEADRAAAVSGITNFSQVLRDPEETGIRDQFANRRFSCSVPQLFQEGHQRVWLLRARLGQDRFQFARVWEADTGVAKVLTDLPGVLALAISDILRQLLQRVRVRIETVAEDIVRFASPRGTYFHGSQEGKLLLRCKLLQFRSGLGTIMIGNSSQAKLFAYQVVDQLCGHPGAIAVNGMQLEVNSRISRQNNRESEWFHARILSKSAK